MSKLWLYDDFVASIENLNDSPRGEVFNQTLSGNIMNLLVNRNIPIEDKLKGLEFVGKKIDEYYSNNNLEITMIWAQIIQMSYNALIMLSGGEASAYIVYLQRFNNDISESRYRPLKEYFEEIIVSAAMIYSENGEVVIEDNLWDKYALPQWMFEETEKSVSETTPLLVQNYKDGGSDRDETTVSQNKMMAFTEAVKSAFSHYADFSGRARRSEYWGFAFFVTIISLIPVVGYIGSLVTLIPMLAVGARRLHDIGKSGWFLLLLLVPFVGGIILLVFFCQDSHPNENEYGVSPKYAGNPSLEFSKAENKQELSLVDRAEDEYFSSNSKSGSSLKDKFFALYNLEKRIWGEQINANKYLAPLSIIIAALAGSLKAGCEFLNEVFSWNLEPISLTALIGMLILFMGYNIAESIIASESAKVATLRALMVNGFLILGCILGAVLSVIILAIIIVVVVGFLLITGLRVAASVSMSSSGGSDEMPSEGRGYWTTTDENGSQIDLKSTGGGYAEDQYGKQWRRDGGDWIRD